MKHKPQFKTAFEVAGNKFEVFKNPSSKSFEVYNLKNNKYNSHKEVYDYHINNNKKKYLEEGNLQSGKENDEIEKEAANIERTPVNKVADVKSSELTDFLSTVYKGAKKILKEADGNAKAIVGFVRQIADSISGVEVSNYIR